MKLPVLDGRVVVDMRSTTIASMVAYERMVAVMREAELLSDDADRQLMLDAAMLLSVTVDVEVVSHDGDNPEIYEPIKKFWSMYQAKGCCDALRYYREYVPFAFHQQWSNRFIDANPLLAGPEATTPENLTPEQAGDPK